MKMLSMKSDLRKFNMSSQVLSDMEADESNTNCTSKCLLVGHPVININMVSIEVQSDTALIDENGPVKFISYCQFNLRIMGPKYYIGYLQISNSLGSDIVACR